MSTNNKNLNLPAFQTANWDEPLNENFEWIDLALGGRLDLNVTGQGISTVALTIDQCRNLIINITGTLTSNVSFSIPDNVGGSWIVRNGTTGNFTVTLHYEATSFVAPQGAQVIVYTDQTTIRLADSTTASVGAANRIAYSDGSTLVGSADLTYASGQLRVAREEATTAAPVAALQLTSRSSGTVAENFGTGITMLTEIPNGNILTGAAIYAQLTSATLGSEDYTISLRALQNGSLVDLVRISGTDFTYEGNDILTSRSAAGTAVQQLLLAGFTSSSDDDGNFTSGTYTPSPVGGNFKTIQNRGSFTIADPTFAGNYTLIVQLTNATGAGAVTLSGFSRVTGDALTTVVGNDFFLFITRCNGFTSCVVQALQ